MSDTETLRCHIMSYHVRSGHIMSKLMRKSLLNCPNRIGVLRRVQESREAHHTSESGRWLDEEKK